MTAQHIAVHVHKIPRSRDRVRILLDEFRVVMIRDKADLLAVGLVGHVKPKLLRHLPNLILGVFPHRHQRVGKLVLSQVIEGVGLVLRRRRRLFQSISAAWKLLHPGVMARGDIIRANVHAAL